MIHAICQALPHITKRNDILAVVAGNCIHDGSGDNNHQKGHYEESIQPHNAGMLRHIYAQIKNKVGDRIGSTLTNSE